MHSGKIDDLLDSLENGHMIIDENFIIKYWNKWLYINTQISSNEIVGKSLEEFFPDLNYRVLKRKIKTALALGGPTFYDPSTNTKFLALDRNKVTTSSLTLMQQQVTISPYDKDEKQVLISLYDISELHETRLLLQKEIDKVKKFNTQLESLVQEAVRKNERQLEQMIAQSRLVQMGEMISMIAHQWRQPLGAIASTSIAIKMKSALQNYDLSNENEAKEYEKFVNEQMDSIDSLVQNLTSTIDDFRNFYKPNNIKNRVKLEDIIKMSLSIIGASLKNFNIDVKIENNSNDELDVYENELMQVVLNMLNNSQDNFLLKKTNNPIIEITTKDKSIMICDNGGGIQEDIMEKIFDPYFTTKDEMNGTGLGLYMSKIIVEEHHDGKLIVNNTDDGVCFTIEL